MQSSENIPTWYVLAVDSNCEALVKTRAKEIGYELYYPIAKNGGFVRNNRYIEFSERPAMPGYVFVPLDTIKPRFDLFQPPYMGSLSRGVKSSLPSFDHQGQTINLDWSGPAPMIHSRGFVSGITGPLPIPHRVIEDLKTREKNKEFDTVEESKDGKHYLPRWVKRDVGVFIIKGPFASFSGIIQRTINYKTVMVEVMMFGRSHDVELPLNFIERITEARKNHRRS